MVKELKETGIPIAENPVKGAIEEFDIVKIESGELQEFVDPEIIRESFENALMTDIYMKIYMENKKWGKVTELCGIPDIITYRHKINKIQGQYGILKIGLKVKYLYDGKNWKIILP